MCHLQLDIDFKGYLDFYHKTLVTDFIYKTEFTPTSVYSGGFQMLLFQIHDQFLF